MKIRRSTLDDAVALARIHRNTIRSVNSKDYSPEVIEGWTSRSTAKKFRDFHDKSIRYVAVENEQVIGFGELIKDTGNLGAMYVDKNFIGQGVGKKLFAVLEKEAIKRGVTQFEFESSTTAKEFYERCGCYGYKKKSTIACVAGY